MVLTKGSVNGDEDAVIILGFGNGQVITPVIEGIVILEQALRDHILGYCRQLGVAVLERVIDVSVIQDQIGHRDSCTKSYVPPL